MRHRWIVVTVVTGLALLAPGPAQATSCVLNGAYVLSSALSFEGTPGQFSGTFTFSPPGDCATPGVAGTVDLSLSVLFAGGTTPLTFAGSFPYTVDDAGVVTIGPGLFTGFVAAAAGLPTEAPVANAFVFVAAPTFADPTLRLAGTAVRSRLDGITIVGGRVAVGISALAAALAANAVPNFTVAIGSNALSQNMASAHNTAVGSRALELGTTGGGNTAVGSLALQHITGNSNIALGADAGVNLTTGDSNIMIGNQGTGGDSATIRLGQVQTRTFIAGIRNVTTDVTGAVPVLIDSFGQLGTTSSSRRVKEDIQDMGERSRGLLQLRPVTFRYRQPSVDGTKRLQYGLIAEEVAEVYPELVAFTPTGETETVLYHLLPAMLLNELQQQYRVNEAQEAELERQHRVNQAQQAELESLAARLAELAGRLQQLERGASAVTAAAATP